VLKVLAVQVVLDVLVLAVPMVLAAGAT